jgi:hypothetical protein
VFLVDTSVWVEVFQKPKRFDLQSAIEMDDVVTCLPIIQEVLQGFKDEKAYRIAREAMFAFPVVESPLPRGVLEEAVMLYRAARRTGMTPRSSVDCLIAACALRHDLTVLHRDRDFEALTQVSLLRAQDISR